MTFDGMTGFDNRKMTCEFQLSILFRHPSVVSRYSLTLPQWLLKENLYLPEKTFSRFRNYLSLTCIDSFIYVCDVTEL